MKSEIIEFRDPQLSNKDGIVHVGGELIPENIISAYKKGIFPWPHSEDFPMLWYSPDPRGVLYVEKFRINKSFEKFIKKTNFKVTFNHCFRDIVEHCQHNLIRQEPTWITEDLLNAYCTLYEQGFAYSIEIWNEEELVGGLYGIKINNFYSAESMFYLSSNASKLAIYHLVDTLKANNIAWLDIQMVTPITAQLGGEEISRKKFLNLLQGSID